MTTTWDNLINARDAEGNLTDTALALDAISDTGCDCDSGHDWPHTCLAGKCEAAIREQWERAEKAEAELEKWKDSSGLECGGDPDGVTPESMRRYWEAVERDRDEWRTQHENAVACWYEERDRLGAELVRLRHALMTISRCGAPGASIVARRTDGHACAWCRGMLTPCPVETARLALEAEEVK